MDVWQVPCVVVIGSNHFNTIQSVQSIYSIHSPASLPDYKSVHCDIEASRLSPGRWRFCACGYEHAPAKLRTQTVNVYDTIKWMQTFGLKFNSQCPKNLLSCIWTNEGATADSTIRSQCCRSKLRCSDAPEPIHSQTSYSSLFTNLYLLEVHWLSYQFIVFRELFPRRQLDEDLAELTAWSVIRNTDWRLARISLVAQRQICGGIMSKKLRPIRSLWDLGTSLQATIWEDTFSSRAISWGLHKKDWWQNIFIYLFFP